VKFEVNGTEEQVRAAITSLGQDLGNCDIYFWATPVIDGGYLCMK